MDRIEEVDNIILAYGCAVLKAVPSTLSDKARREYVNAICELFPEPKPETETEAYFRGKKDGMTIKEFQTKPDKDRLLRDEEILNRVTFNAIQNPMLLDWLKAIAEIQDAKTASIMWSEWEKECEACADGFISTHEKATNEIRAKLDAERQARIEALIDQLKDNAKLIIAFCNQEKKRVDVDKDALIITMRDMVHSLVWEHNKLVVGIVEEFKATALKGNKEAKSDEEDR